MNTENTVWKTRLAEPEDAQMIWQLYLKTGFLYPGKLAALGDGGTQAMQTLEAMLALRLDSYRIVLAYEEPATIRAAVTCGCSGANLSSMMHMASDGSPPALLIAFVEAVKIAITSPSQWLNWTFRPGNASIFKLFTQPVMQLSERVEIGLYDFYTVNALKSREMARNSRSVRTANDGDLMGVLSHVENQASEWSALSSIGFLEDANLGAPAYELHRHAQTRKRRAFVLEDDEKTRILAVADIAPPWWNLSNLSTGVRFWQTDPAVSPKDYQALLEAVAYWFGDYGVGNWTILANPAHTALATALARAGIECQKQYQRVAIPIQAAPGVLCECVRLIRHPDISAEMKQNLKKNLQLI